MTRIKHMQKPKYLTLMNYAQKRLKTPVNLNDLDHVAEITIRVVSGDEIADIEFKDGRVEHFDTGVLNPRVMSFFDGAYTLYSEMRNINRIAQFQARKHSYDDAFARDEDGDLT